MKLITTLFIFLFGFSIYAQEQTSNYRSTKVAVNDSIKIDSVSINNSWFLLKRKDNSTIDSSYYHIDFKKAILTFKKLVETDFEFKNINEAADSPLATELFNFPYVKEVFISENYVSITKLEIVEWNEITIEVRSFIRQYINDEKVVVSKNFQQTKKTQTAIETPMNLDDVSKQIISILDEYVKPAVAADGGNIAFQSYDVNTQTVNVILQGACSGCPSSTVTLKNGIENMLKQMIPGKIGQVVAVNY